jgi:ABC-type Fe3+-hydroxamate transport system substrate-binding protein
MATRDKAFKFVELANRRVNRAIKDLQLVANLANRQNYEFSEDQAKKIIKALQAELDALKQNFLGAVDSGTREFKL